VWKLYGERLDGFSNDDHPSEKEPGSGKLFHKGGEVDLAKNKSKADIDYNGKVMPPPFNPAGAAPLTDEEKRTVARWIDLGCPIDLDYDPKNPEKPGYGWMLDDQRPTLALTLPAPGKNAELSRVLIGMQDHGTGLNPDSFRVTADFEIDGVAAGENLAPRFTSTSRGVWELKLSKPLTELPAGTLTVSVADRQGNVTRIERKFKAGK
jgi:hypothetical protein